MSLNRPGDNGGSEFTHPHLRELDTLMLGLVPGKRAAFLHAAYARAMAGSYEKDFIEQLAGLLRKWSTEKRSFLDHAEKLLAKDGGQVQERMDSTSELVKNAINDGAEK